MDLGFPLASSLLGADPFRSAFSDPFFRDAFSGSTFGDWPVGTTFRRPLLGGSRALRGTEGGIYRIPCDMYEKENKYEYRFELAGCAQENIDMSVEDNDLVIKCERCKGCPEDYDTLYMQECPVGTYQRTLKLPLDADPDTIVSCYANGILSVTVPKLKGKSTRKKLAITSGAKSSSSSGSK